MTPPPLVTVIVPARNEEADIAGCIDAVGAQDHGPERIQLVVVDSGSTDGTVAEVLEAACRYPFSEVVIGHNPRQRTSISLNLGLDRAKGDYVARVDARSRIPPDYVSTCLRILAQDPGVGVAGGAQVAVPRSSRAVDLGIARALRNRWATGLSRYRRSTRSGPSDTVWMGFFRTADLRALGGWSEAVALNEDFELNRRYRNSGHTVWFEAAVRSGYLPSSSLRALSRQYFYFGRVKGMWWARGDRPTARQVALLVAPLGAASVLATLWRRLGPASVVAAPVALVALEVGGGGGPAPARAHAAAAVAVAVLSGSWWVGTVVGFAGELVSVRHQHG
jgi:succinoglycan biosynthesis protein ExoA